MFKSSSAPDPLIDDEDISGPLQTGDRAYLGVENTVESDDEDDERTWRLERSLHSGSPDSVQRNLVEPEVLLERLEGSNEATERIDQAASLSNDSDDCLSAQIEHSNSTDKDVPRFLSTHNGMTDEDYVDGIRVSHFPDRRMANNHSYVYGYGSEPPPSELFHPPDRRFDDVDEARMAVPTTLWIEHSESSRQETSDNEDSMDFRGLESYMWTGTDDWSSHLCPDRQRMSDNSWETVSTRTARKDERSGIYSPLDKQGGEVRLLTVRNARKYERKSSTSANVSFTMTSASLDEPNLRYDALSYVWGNPACTKEIRVNDKRLCITENLFAALSLLSRSGAPSKPIWIDAICIDQQNTSERNHQVSLMKRIYENAQEVHIYLGSGTSNTAVTIDGAKSIAAGISIEELTGANRLANSHLRDLFTCPWWTRLWVLQEAALAKRPIVHWGANSIPFWDLMKSMAAARNAKVYGHFDDVEESHEDNQDEWVYRFDQAVFSFTVLRRHGQGPELVLSVSSNLEATDDRDRIYGVLALMPSLKQIVPDYNLSANAIFQRTALEVMKQEQNLRLLRLIRRTAKRPPRSTPSWVPAFSGLTGIIGQHSDEFGFKGNDVSIPFSLDEVGARGIRVNAMITDTVKAVGPSCRREAQGRNRATKQQSSTQERLRLTLQRWFELAARQAKSESACPSLEECHHSSHSHRCVRMEFWRSILCDGLFDFVLGRKGRDLSVDIKAYDRWLQGERWTPRPTVYQNQELQMFVGSSNFFVTKAGRKGLSRSDVQTDDEIALLGGETIPYVLRPRVGTLTKMYAVVGSCFCNGLMYGEAIEAILATRSNEAAQEVVANVFEKIVFT